MGEDIPGIGAVRNMMNPNLFGDPGKMSDAAQFVCALPGGDAGGVHSNSGVPNHAYALMVDGGTYNGFTISGIGLTKAGKIQYRALTSYLLSASDFLDNYNALKRSCTDLIGTAGITAADCTEVGKALDAVEMANPWPCSPPQAAVPAFCPVGQVASNLFFDNLENTASGNWAISTIAGTGHWFYPPDPDFIFATSGVNNFWGYDRPVVGDSAIAMTSSVAIPTGTVRLQFNHSYGFENSSTSNFDGGVIEYSTNAGAIWSDAGSLISAGATYGGPIASAFSNPLAGRNAFVKGSFGYTASQLNLASLAGQNARFRFRIGTDISADDYGWFIDDIRLYQCFSGSTRQARDFDGDAKNDILWRHTSGVLVTWFLNGASVTGLGSPGGADANWTVQGAGDFNGDGRADILWRHTSGAVYMWLMNGTSIIGAGFPGTVATDWTIAGVGDFNGDGKADILWRHTSGLVYIWLMNGTSIIGAGSPGSVGTDWTIQGVGDVNGDARADIVWRHTSGAVAVWMMNGLSLVGASTVGSAGPDWSIQRIADVNGDGKADILWRHTSGGVFVWLLNGTSISSIGSIGSADLTWTIVGAYDFNADGRSDILWRHTSGAVFVWLLNGASIIGLGSPGSVDASWAIQ